MNRDDISFYLLMLGTAFTIFSLLMTFLYSQQSDICIIDSIQNENMQMLSNCKNTINEEVSNMFMGVIGVILLGSSAAVKVNQRKQSK